MKALILAAGIGSRLNPITNTKPKCMVEVCNTPIIFQQVSILKDCGISEIYIVTGHLSNMLTAYLDQHFSDLHYIQNAEYLNTNNMYSAYLSRLYLCGEAFIMMNADVFFDTSALANLLSFESSNAIVVDSSCYLPESMKVSLTDQRISSISKNITKNNAFGCSIDVYKFDKNGSKAFFDKCEDYIVKNNQTKLWSEVAINDIFSVVPFFPCPLNGRWIEIDDHEDLRIANEMFASQSSKQ